MNKENLTKVGKLAGTILLVVAAVVLTNNVVQPWIDKRKTSA